MYLPKLLYDEFKKILNERNILSKHLNKIDREYFLFVKKELFNINNYQNLDKTKKLLFNNESDYENQKFIFEEIDDFFKMRRFFIGSAYIFLAIKLFIAEKASTNEFYHKRLFNNFKKSPKLFCLKAFIFSLITFAGWHYEKKYFEFDFANKINTNSRLGIFLWFESNFRLGLLNKNTINFLDEEIQMQINLISKEIKSELNEEILHKLIFYALLKQHYFNFFATKFLANIIIPLLNTENNHNQKHEENYFLSIVQQSFMNNYNERFFSFSSELDYEINAKRTGIYGKFKSLVASSLNDKGLNGNNEGNNDKVFLNENSLASLIRIDEIKQIYLNDFIQENLKKFYEDYKKGNI